jgi:hypothetical protein
MRNQDAAHPGGYGQHFDVRQIDDAAGMRILEINCGIGAVEGRESLYG